MDGFDREGKGGIGFDVGKGAMGGVKGFLTGKLGQSGAKALAARSAAPVAAQAPVPNVGLYDPFANAFPAPPQATGGVDMMGKLGKVLNFAKENPAAVGSALQGAGSVLGARMEQDAARERLDFEREREEEDRRRRAMMAQLLMPLYLQEQERSGLSVPQLFG